MSLQQVICDLPNASLEISGVKFTALDDGGVISEPIKPEVAETFLSIPGYTLYEGNGSTDSDTPPAPTAPTAPNKPLTKAQKEAAAKKAQEEAEAAKKAQEEADRLAAEEAAKKAEEEAAALQAAQGNQEPAAEDQVF